jgi:RNA 3'-phosphate cyclase
MQMQHLTAITALSKICNAKVSGAKHNSMEVEFIPGKVRESNFSVNISTAGSVCLFLQALLLPSMLEKQKISVVGGTDVPWSPSYHYFNQVLLPHLSKMNARFDSRIQQHGFFPKGRGKVFFSSKKTKFPIKPIFLGEQGKLSQIKIFSQSSDLPKEVSLNQFSAAKKVFEKLNVHIEKEIYSREQSQTIGSSIDVFAFFDNGVILGANALGKKDKPAIEVGKEAAENLLKEISSGKPVDSFLSDQLIPFMALADGYSTIQLSNFSSHCQEAISVTEKFLDAKFQVKGKLDKPAEIFVEGISWKP